MKEPRKLASIRQVSQVVPIEGSDNIELAKIDGWQCVVKKGDFKQGDLAVYFEIDSLLPIEPRYEFLRKSSLVNFEGSEGFRIKTIRLRKQLSQGLLLPLKDFPELKLKTVNPEDNLGLNLTDILSVKKWERPEEKENNETSKELTFTQKTWAKVKPYVPSFILKRIYYHFPNFLEGKSKTRNFPSFLQKTDQERIQNIPDVLTQHWNTEFEITEKLDGSSLTAYLYKGKFGVCSRNIDLGKSEGNKFWQTAINAQLEKVLRGLGRNLALQGEMVGVGVQGNPYGLKDTKFFLFDVYDIDKRRYLTVDERKRLSDGSIGVDVNCVCGYIDNRMTLQKFVESHGLTEELIQSEVEKSVLKIIEEKHARNEADVGDYDKIVQFVTRQKRMEAFLACASGFSGINNQVRREGIVLKSCGLIDGQVLSFKAISNEYLEKEK